AEPAARAARVVLTPAPRVVVRAGPRVAPLPARPRMAAWVPMEVTAATAALLEWPGPASTAERTAATVPAGSVAPVAPAGAADPAWTASQEISRFLVARAAQVA